VKWAVSEDFLNQHQTWQWNTLASGELLSGLSPGDTVTASIAWEGNRFKFTADGPGGPVTQYYPSSGVITGTINPPTNPGKYLQTRIHLNTDTTPEFSWYPVAGAERYRVRIYNHDSSKTVWNGHTTGDETNYKMPPGILKPNAVYTFRLDAWDGGNPGFDVDNRSRTPSNSSESYIFHTGSQEDPNPHLELSAHGVHTYSTAADGTMLSFWVLVHDAQGVPDNINYVRVQHPDGPVIDLQPECGTQWRPGTATACIYSAESSTLPITGGTYTFTVQDDQGNTAATVYEDFVPDAIGYPNAANHSPANGVTVGSTAVDFTWDSVTGAAFYTLVIYDYVFNLAYQFHIPQPQSPPAQIIYNLPEGFLKEGAVYYWRVITRRELFSQNSGASGDVEKNEFQDRDQADPGKNDKSISNLLHFFSLKMDILKNP